jgi:metallo-beta-lactamase family protein
MEIKLNFLGAAQNVTGSRHLLQVNGSNILVDCGLYQERQFRDRNWEDFPFPPKKIDAVLLTHAHLDHCGLLPKLVREGFDGPIYCTPATADIAKIILLDSAKLQEEDAEHKRKRHKKEGRKGPYPEIPLYTTEEAEASFLHFEPVSYNEPLNLGNGNPVEATFYDAGHILGSSIIKVRVGKNDSDRTIIFTGDIGRTDRPFVADPTVFEKADYVLIESTYGDRIHNENIDIKKVIGDIINSTRKAGGNIVIPSFALERSQEVIYYISELLSKKTIKPIKIFLDSPMATKIIEVFKKHAEALEPEMAERVRNHHSPFELPGLECTCTTEQSKAINKIKKSAIIIAGSGMCTGGRIKHHLISNITRPESTIMFVGYQASGTLGRLIVDGQQKVRIMGQEYPVRARIVRVNGFSAHADKQELLEWLENIKTAPRGIFVVHGETESAKSFGDFVYENTGWPVSVPAYLQQISLN